MFELKLFLGFIPDDRFQHALDQSNAYLVSAFIGKKEYLQEIIHDNKRYLGKFLDVNPSLEQLKDLEVHVLSLVHALVPNYTLEHNPLTLVTLTHGS